MKIKLGSVWLAETGALAVSGLRLDQVRSVQTADYIGAAFSAAFPRGNKRHTVSFQVTRIHASIADAQRFVFDHPATVPESGLLYMEPAAGVGRWIEDAVVVEVSLVALTGLTSQWSYTLIGGEVLATDPTLPP